LSSAPGDPSAGAAGPRGAGSLACPSCGSEHALDERFCARCEMPLVVGGDPALAEAPVSDAHARARKIRPELARGELVRVAGGRNQAEAELIHGYLLEEGIPSLVRRSAGSDVPDFLAAGQRDVLVPSSGAPAARELLSEAELAAAPARARPGADAASVSAPGPRVARLVGAILGGGLLTAVVAWLLAGAGG
jgi:hypothetical protein